MCRGVHVRYLELRLFCSGGPSKPLTRLKRRSERAPRIWQPLSPPARPPSGETLVLCVVFWWLPTLGTALCWMVMVIGQFLLRAVRVRDVPVWFVVWGSGVGR